MKRKPLRNLIKRPQVYLGTIVMGVVAFVAVFAPWLTPMSPDEMDIAKRLCDPGSEHWLGCDLNGGDVLTSLMYGARTSLYVGLLTVIFSMSLGVAIGLISGYKGGWTDIIIMRIVDILLAFPGILLAMALTAVLGPSIHNIIIAISATGWIGSARLVRGQVLSIREREHVHASRALGASDFRTMFIHILPLAVPHLLVHATFSVSGVILVEASLSFLGLAPTDGPPTWGALLSQGKEVLTEAPNLTLAPGIAIMLVVLSLNLLGDALRDWSDPKNYVR